MSVILGIAAAGALGLAAAGLLFWRSDADAGLLLRGKHGKDAFRGKVVWITGSSQGMGELLALYLASQGARLILSSRSEGKLQRVKAACLSAGAADALVLPFDLLGGDAALRAAADAADAAFGGAGVDFLVHNAGASQRALAAETTGDVARQLIELNALAPIQLTQAALPHMARRRKGQLVVVASMAAKVPSPGQAVYSAAKSSLLGYFGSLAAELADQGVSVTVCCPGPVATGTPDEPRALFGPAGMIRQPPEQDKHRMAPPRAVRLIADAMAAGVAECWMATQPVLLMAHLAQYCPPLARAVMRKVGPSRARSISSGRSGYDLHEIMSAAGSKAAANAAQAAPRSGGAAE